MSAPASGLAQIGKSVFIKGELSGSEDLYLDGQVEGSIALKGNSLTVGPNGQVKPASTPRAWWFKASLRATFRPAIASNYVSPRSLPGTSAPSGFPSKKAHI